MASIVCVSTEQAEHGPVVTDQWCHSRLGLAPHRRHLGRGRGPPPRRRGRASEHAQIKEGLQLVRGAISAPRLI
uniref:Uncharacterized protein n=1 Tax=Aegilops tauschii TaxID=37682 RepID=R7WA73_AEGTA